MAEVEQRLAVAEGLLPTLRHPRAEKSLALTVARKLLRGERSRDELTVEEAVVGLTALVEAAQKTLRATSGKKGTFHGMHGRQKAVRHRTLLPGPHISYCPTCNSILPSPGGACPNDPTHVVPAPAAPADPAKLVASAPTDEMGERLDSDEHTPAIPTRKRTRRHLDAARKSVPTDDSGRSMVAQGEKTALGFTDVGNAGLIAAEVTESQPSANFDLPAEVSKHRKKRRKKHTDKEKAMDEKLNEGGGDGYGGALGVTALMTPAVAGVVGNVSTPPNLRAAEGWERCGNCVFFHKGCNLYGVNRPPVDSINRGMYPTKEDMVCDSQRTVTPPEARAFSSLSGAQQQLAVAEAAGDADGVVAARARVELLESRLQETWSPAARAAAILARRNHSGGGVEGTADKLKSLKPGATHNVARGVNVNNDETHGLSVTHHGRVISRHGTDAMAAAHAAHQHADLDTAKKDVPGRVRHKDPMLDSAYRAKRAAIIAKHGGPKRTVLAAEIEEELVALAEEFGFDIEEVKSDAYPGLDRSPKKNWVDKAGGLPRYIERIAKHLHYEKGKEVGHAIAIAVNVVKRMCASGDTNFPGKQNVNAKSRGEACAAVAEWEAKKAKSKGKDVKEGWTDAVPEAGMEIAEAVFSDWEPNDEFTKALVAMEAAFKPIPPSWNFIEALHSEIALVEGTREWMSDYALDVAETEETEEVEEGLWDSAKHPRGRSARFRDVLGKLDVELKTRSGKKESFSAAGAGKGAAKTAAASAKELRRDQEARSHATMLAQMEGKSSAMARQMLYLSTLDKDMQDRTLRHVQKLATTGQMKPPMPLGGHKKPSGSGDDLDDLSVDNAVGTVLSSFEGVNDWHIEPMQNDAAGKPYWAVHIHHAKGHSVAHVHGDGTVTDAGTPGEHVPLTGVTAPVEKKPEKFSMKTVPKTTKKAKAVFANAKSAKVFTLANYFHGEDVDPKFAQEELGKWKHAKMSQTGPEHYSVHVHSNLWYEIHSPEPESAVVPPKTEEPAPMTSAQHMAKLAYYSGAGVPPTYASTDKYPDITDAFEHIEAHPEALEHASPKTLKWINKAAEDANWHTVSGYAETLAMKKFSGSTGKTGPSSPSFSGVYNPNDYEHTGDYNVPSHMPAGTIYKGTDGVHYMHQGDAWKGKVKGYSAQNLKTGTSKFVPYFAVHGHDYEIHQLKGTGPIKTPGEAKSSADKVFADLMDSVKGNKGSVDSVVGKNIVVTGVIPGYKRAEVHAMIEKAGGTPHGSVAASTHVLVTGEKVGASKINAAAAKGVAVIPWDEFRHLIESLVPADELKLVRVNALLVEAEDTEEIVRLQARKGVLESRLGGNEVLARLGLEERYYSTADRKAMAKTGQALDDGSFPIKDRVDLKNAIGLLGKAKDKSKAAAHIAKRAAALGAKDMLDHHKETVHA